MDTRSGYATLVLVLLAGTLASSAMSLACQRSSDSSRTGAWASGVHDMEDAAHSAVEEAAWVLQTRAPGRHRIAPALTRELFLPSGIQIEPVQVELTDPGTEGLELVWFRATVSHGPHRRIYAALRAVERDGDSLVISPSDLAWEVTR